MVRNALLVSGFWLAVLLITSTLWNVVHASMTSSTLHYISTTNTSCLCVTGSQQQAEAGRNLAPKIQRMKHTNCCLTTRCDYCSAKLKGGLSESGSSFQGIFRRGGQYDELLDHRAESPTRLEERGSMSDGEAEQRRPPKGESPLNGTRTGSGTLTDGLFSRLNLKEKRTYMPMSRAAASSGRIGEPSCH